MPKAISEHDRIINYFMSASIETAELELATAKTILANRKKATTPAAVAGEPAVKKTRKTRTSAANRAPASVVETPPPVPVADFV